jgi:hypothetical protein
MPRIPRLHVDGAFYHVMTAKYAQAVQTGVGGNPEAAKNIILGAMTELGTKSGERAAAVIRSITKQ